MKIATFIAAAIVALSALPQEADAHAFLLLPKPEFTVGNDKKNHNSYVVPGDKAPGSAPYKIGRDEENAKMFMVSYKNINPPSLRDFILKNEVPAQDKGIPSGGTAECGFTKANGPAQPIPDHIEFGNYNLQISGGLHPGPCEAWCDNEIVVPFTEDCRTRFQKPIAYDKSKCVGKSRFTFYWLATHFAPFQVYIGCVPLQGGKPGGGGSNNTLPSVPTPAPGPSKKDNTAPLPTVPAPAPAPSKKDNPAPLPTVPAPAPAPSKKDNTAPLPTVPAPAPPSKCGVKGL